MATTRITRRNFNQENAVVQNGKASLVQNGKGRVLRKPSTRAPFGNVPSNIPTVQSDKLHGFKDAFKIPDVPLKPKIENEVVPVPMETSAIEVPSTKNIQITDIDEEDHENPQLVTEYVNEIYEYMRELEVTFSISKAFLDGKEVTSKMRSVLLDWLIQVHQRFHLLQETLYLTVAILDRFLQCTDVTKNKLQLVGVTAMLIASKYEEMYAPEVGDFEYITDSAYSKGDIRKMECFMLRSLDFNLGRPLPLHFLRRNSKAAEVDATKHNIAKYLMELTIVEYDLAHISPSEIAAAALCLSMKLWDESQWNVTVAHHSKYSEEDLLPTMRKLAVLLLKAGEGKHTAVYVKYKSSKYLRVSLIPELSSSAVRNLANSL